MHMADGFKLRNDSYVLPSEQGWGDCFGGRFLPKGTRGSKPQFREASDQSFTHFLQAVGSLLCYSYPQFSPRKCPLILQNPAQEFPKHFRWDKVPLASFYLPELPLPRPLLGCISCSPVSPPDSALGVKGGGGMVINMFLDLSWAQHQGEPKSKGETGSSLLPSLAYTWPCCKNIYRPLPRLGPRPLLYQLTAMSPDRKSHLPS